ncbi:MAG: MopE-related protein [Ferruginibacter sp.]
MNNSSTGSFIATGNNSLLFFGGGANFTNAGVFAKSNSAGTTTIAIGLVNTGTIKGIGTLNCPFLTNSGIIAPGITTGSLTLNGSQPLSANSFLQIEFAGGTDYDLLEKSGNLTLSGTLNITETGTVPPGVYTIINLISGAISGNFNNINLPPCYTLQVNATTVTVTKALASAPTINASGPLTFCQGGSVTLTSSSPTGNTWSNGATSQSIVVNTGGVYTVTFINPFGCLSVPSASVTVTVNPLPAAPIISANGPTTFCQGGNVILTSNAASGNLWSNGETTQSITVSSGSSNTVTSTDNNGCTSLASLASVVTVNPLPATPTISANGPTTFCVGNAVTLTSSASTGNLWSTGVATNSIFVNSSGTFTVTHTNAVGCSATSAAIDVIVNPLPATPILTSSFPTIICPDQTVTLTSSAVTGNLWSTGATTQTIVVNQTGLYSLSTVDENGCVSNNNPSQQVTVVPTPATPEIQAMGPTTFCQGGSVALSLSSSSIPGTFYYWSTSQSGQFINVNSSGSYTLVASGAFGCRSNPSLPIVVTVNPLPPMPTITPASTTTFCEGGSVILTSSAATGNLWSNGATTQSIVVNTSGSFTVAYTDLNGCTSPLSAATMVIVNLRPAAATITANGPISLCFGQEVILTSSAASGNRWSNGQTTQSITVNYATAGVYILGVESEFGCISDPTIITVEALPQAAFPLISANGPNSFCQGGSVMLTSNVSQGIMWSNGEITQTITVTQAGDYSVTVTNSSGCSTQSGPTTVTVYPTPVAPTIIPNGNTSFCSGGSVLLSSSMAPLGNANHWSNGDVGQSTTINSSGTYTLTYIDAQGCTSLTSQPVTVTVSPLANFYQDNDGDGFGNPQSVLVNCVAPAGYVTNNTDCNDNNATIHPGAAEIINNMDDNCDGIVDNNCAEGGFVWQKLLGGSNSEINSDMKQTSDGGYILAGSTASGNGDINFNHGNADAWIVKLNNTGSIQWQKTYGGTGAESAISIQQTTDGGFIFAGYSNSNDGDLNSNHGQNDGWVVKINNTGQIEWQKLLGGSSNDMIQHVEQTADGGYICAGYSHSNNGDVSGNHGSEDFWVIKLNSAGQIQWQKSYGGTSSEVASSIRQTSEGGYIVSGSSFSNNGDVSGNHGSEDFWVIKLNSAGQIQWQKSLGGTAADHASSIQETADGGYVVGGRTSSNNGNVTGNHGSTDYWILKLNNAGQVQWQKTLGGTSYDAAIDIEVTSDAGYIVTGRSNSTNGDVTSNNGQYDCWVVKLDNSGIMQWQKSLGGILDDNSYSIHQTQNGGFIVAGYSYSNNGDFTSNHGNGDFWIVNLSGITPVAFFRDNDGDGYGNSAISITACSKPAGYVADNTDCDDTRNTSYPGAPELCGNFLDDNCNGIIDENNTVNEITQIYGTVNVCPYVGTSTQIAYSIAPVSNATSYVWTVPASSTLVSGQGTNTIFLTFGSGFTASADKQIRVYAVTPCNVSNTKIFYLAAQLPSTPQPIVASTTDICPAIGTNTAISYTIPKAAGASGYIWTASTSTMNITHPATGSNDTTVLVTFSAAFTTGSISVQAINECGVSSLRNLAVTKIIPSAPGLINGPGNACAYIAPGGILATYSVAATAGIASYTWVLPAGAVNVTGQGTGTISFKYPAGFTSGSISVTATNGCGTSAARTKAISTLYPATPGVVDVIQLQACPLRKFSYTLAAMPSNAQSLQWTVPAGALLFSGQGTTSIVVFYPNTSVTGSVNVIAISNCRNSTVRSTPVKLPACPTSFAKGNDEIPAREVKEAENSKAFSVDIFPNPSSTLFNLKINSMEKERVEIKVLDMQGRMIKKISISPFETMQLGASFSPGIYMLEIKQDKNIMKKRLIKF